MTIFTPIFSSLAAAVCSSSKPRLGSCTLTSRAAAVTHCFCSADRLCQSLSLTQTIALLASCSVFDSTGATS